MPASKTGTGAVRRPPTNAKLQRLLEELRANPGDYATSAAAHEVIRKLYMRGLPRGLDPAVVTAVITERLPHGAEIQRLARGVGTEYDEAIIAGVRAHVELVGPMHVLEVALVAALTERVGVPFNEAFEQLWHAERQVERDYNTNLPTDRSPEVLERVSAAMDAWFAPTMLEHTLALARGGMGPTAWSNGKEHGATPPQGDEEWALFIGCALHPSEAVAAVLAPRCALIPRLDEPGLSAISDVLRYARSKHGAQVPAPPD